MPTDWGDLVDLGDRRTADAASADPGADEAEGSGWRRLRRLRERLAKSRQALTAELSASLFERLDGEALERIEEALILADVGARATAGVVGRLEAEVEAGQVGGPEAARERLVELLAELAQGAEAPDFGRLDLSARPALVMVVGVNGTGKTTTIGKLASVLRERFGLSVIVAAADTYRAAAIEQLETWAERAGVELVRGAPGGDAGAVVFDAIEAAESRGADVVIADTAGRLHTHASLMEELAKVGRVAAKRLDGAPHETLCVIDATTGQNGLRQAQAFSEAVEVTGVALTKLDGTAKGGIALAITEQLGIPLKLIGVGEGIEDLRPFDAREFATALIAE